MYNKMYVCVHEPNKYTYYKGRYSMTQRVSEQIGKYYVFSNAP